MNNNNLTQIEHTLCTIKYIESELKKHVKYSTSTINQIWTNFNFNIINGTNLNDLDNHKFVFQATAMIKIFDLYDYDMGDIYVKMYKYLIVILVGTHCHGCESNEIIGCYSYMLSHLFCQLLEKCVQTQMSSDLPFDFINDCKNFVKFLEIHLKKDLDDFMFNWHVSF